MQWANFLTFWQISTLWLSKQSSTCPQELLMKIFFFEKKSFSILVISIGSKIFHLCGELIQRDYQNCIPFSNRNTLRKNNFWLNCSFIYHFRTLTGTFWLSDKILRYDGQNWILNVHRNTVRKFIYYWRKVLAPLYIFQRISEHFWLSGKRSEHGCPNCLRGVHKDTLRDFFWTKTFVSFNHVWTLGESSSTSGQNFFGLPTNFF